MKIYLLQHKVSKKFMTVELVFNENESPFDGFFPELVESSSRHDPLWNTANYNLAFCLANSYGGGGWRSEYKMTLPANEFIGQLDIVEFSGHAEL